ncbi:MAG: PUR family DNA/RNA-binding protein [Rikenella sp.]|nr:PUR family DNA/RNA-binding protein [Rikenella sp.]
MSNFDYNDRSEMDSMGDELYSVPVKAGKRIYYFDVKATRGGDYYLTITESRKKQMRDGSFTIDKHKIHLYKEDFQKFGEGFKEAVDYVKRERPELFNPDGSAIGSNNGNGGSDDDFFKGL